MPGGNNDTPVPPITLETGPVICGRCKRTFANYQFEDVNGLIQLHSGDLIVTHIKANCCYCGWTFHYDIRDKDIEQMVIKYGELRRALGGYTPG